MKTRIITLSTTVFLSLCQMLLFGQDTFVIDANSFENLHVLRNFKKVEVYKRSSNVESLGKMNTKEILLNDDVMLVAYAYGNFDKDSVFDFFVEKSNSWITTVKDHVEIVKKDKSDTEYLCILKFDMEDSSCTHLGYSVYALNSMIIEVFDPCLKGDSNMSKFVEMINQIQILE